MPNSRSRSTRNLSLRRNYRLRRISGGSKKMTQQQARNMVASWNDTYEQEKKAPTKKASGKKVSGKKKASGKKASGKKPKAKAKAKAKATSNIGPFMNNTAEFRIKNDELIKEE